MPLVWHFISLPVFERSQTTSVSNLGEMLSFSLLLFCSFEEERDVMFGQYHFECMTTLFVLIVKCSQ